MGDRVLQLRREVEVRQGPSSSLVLTNAASKRALRVSGSARELLAVLRHGATLQQCVAAFGQSRAGHSDAEQRVRVFLLTLREAGVLVSDGGGDDVERRTSPRGLTVSVPVSAALQNRIRRIVMTVGVRNAGIFVIGLGVIAAIMVVLSVATAGNPIARALANWSWTAALTMILPWMCIHEAAHVVAGVAANATIVGVNASFSITPFRLRTYVTLDPCTLPVDVRRRLALPGAGPLMDVLLCGSVAGLVLLTGGLARDALATSLTMGLWLSALTLLPAGSTDVATMLTIAGQAGARDRSATIWRRTVQAASASGVIAVIGLTAHGLWSRLP